MLATGFVNNMEEWMSAADVIVTKAGPGTIAEAIVSNLPIVLNGFIPCQEFGNVNFVTSRGLGAFEGDPMRIAEVLEKWLLSGSRSTSSRKKDDGATDELASMRAALLPLRPRFRDALGNIVDDLAALCRSGFGGAPHAVEGHRGHGFHKNHHEDGVKAAGAAVGGGK